MILSGKSTDAMVARDSTRTGAVDQQTTAAVEPDEPANVLPVSGIDDSGRVTIQDRALIPAGNGADETSGAVHTGIGYVHMGDSGVFADHSKQTQVIRSLEPEIQYSVALAVKTSGEGRPYIRCHDGPIKERPR